MPTNASLTQNILDPGLGSGGAAASTFLFLGTASAGTVNTLYSFSRKSTVVSTLGQGTLPEAICTTLDIAGGPVYGMRVTGSVAGTTGAVTQSGGGPVVTAAGAANDAYQAIVTVRLGGALGVGKFSYSLDNGETESETLVIPAGGSYLIPNTGVTLTFPAGTYVVDETYSFDTTAPYYSTTDIANAVTAIQATNKEFAVIVPLGKPGDATTGATLFAALSTHMTSFENGYRYLGALQDAGDDTEANAITAFASSASSRIAVTFGDLVMSSSKPFAGWGRPKMGILPAVAAHAAKLLISTKLSRVASGPLGGGIKSITHDSDKSATPLTGDRFTTLRTHQGRPGFYVAAAPMMAAAGSDYLNGWNLRRVMDTACDIAAKEQLLFLDASARTNPDATILEEDAARWETRVQSALDAALKEVPNAEGTKGHVSDIVYAIDRENLFGQTNELITTVTGQPLGYAHDITSTLGLSASLPTPEAAATEESEAV